MAFRADEAVKEGYEKAARYLLGSKEIDSVERSKSLALLDSLIKNLGPVVDAYPSWHPLVRFHDGHHPITHPCRESGYHGLDHTILFANGFITCPYGDGQSVIDSVKKLPQQEVAAIRAKKLDAIFYNPQATPILVQCQWHDSLDECGMIPTRLATGLMLEKELPCWHWSEVGETWESMRSLFLGQPHGSRSSLFVSQETAVAMKKVWNALIATQVFGPVKER